MRKSCSRLLFFKMFNLYSKFFIKKVALKSDFQKNMIATSQWKWVERPFNCCTSFSFRSTNLTIKSNISLKIYLISVSLTKSCNEMLMLEQTESARRMRIICCLVALCFLEFTQLNLLRVNKKFDLSSFLCMLRIA